VAPRWGAWIETIDKLNRYITIKSHPAGVRGLKLFRARMRMTIRMSHPAGVRGLKQFNYFRDEELINIKYRDGHKNFKLFKDAELIPYNLDGIKTSEDVIIVEGEMDALTLWECGFHHVISVPNGANFDWLNNSIDYFEDKKRIILATDADIPGVKLRNELASRLGIERCYKVDFDLCKDANEYLIEHGREKLINILNLPISFPIEG
ncbi:MAG: toprim domain-containing protein, partial [Bacteroidales bacterium]|nr:toprim domain-containing protein [Bacteroidales bacterium]